MLFKDCFDKLIKEKNKKLTEMHQETGISTSYLTDIRKGRHIPSEEKLEKIIKSLLLNPEEESILKKAWLSTKTPAFAKALDIENKREKELIKVIEVLRHDARHSKVPFFRDIAASAGYGCFTNEEIFNCEYIEVPNKYAKKGNIAICVNGDSMEPEIKQNDIIVVNTNEQEFVNKKIVVVQYQEMLYLKKLLIEEDDIFLVSINPFYPRKLIENLDELKIIGKVIYLCRNY
ncbi:LexA family transcriptional regulator [Fusobacterium ulcerans]|uniref:LexA family transcriptional regulator n=1 Tax=Fusobacterium ulcerans TaxID=861 RepID=UPI0027B90E7B|nr:XRE family transcriptional regulator [Fusobacterium ulcerans]